MKQFLLSLFKDVQGNISSKRLAFLVVLVLFVSMALEISLNYGKVTFFTDGTDWYVK